MLATNPKFELYFSECPDGKMVCNEPLPSVIAEPGTVNTAAWVTDQERHVYFAPRSSSSASFDRYYS